MQAHTPTRLNKLVILRSQDSSSCHCLLRKWLEEDRENQFLYSFPNVSPSDWQISRCLQSTLLARTRETHTAYTAAGGAPRSTLCEGSQGMPSNGPHDPNSRSALRTHLPTCYGTWAKASPQRSWQQRNRNGPACPPLFLNCVNALSVFK